MLEHKFDILGLCETRLNDALSTIYQLDHYKGHFQNKNTSGGGLVIFIRDHFQAFTLQNISFKLPHIESLFLKVFHPCTFLVGVIYRPPNSNINEFLQSLEEILLSPLFDKNLNCYIMGDFNINLIRHNHDNYVKEFINLMYSHSMFPTVIKPTRVTDSSASIIDHIWTNNTSNHAGGGILYVTISDHFPIFGIFSLTSSNKQCKLKTLTKTIINEENMLDFKTEIGNYRWEHHDQSLSVNEEFVNYLHNFTLIYKKHFKTKTFTIKAQHSDKPYITAAIKESIKHRHKLQKLSVKWPLTYGALFKRYRNTLTSTIRQAKENYYKTRLQEYSGNASKTWNVINELLCRNKSQNPTSFLFNNRHVSNNHDIAECFNSQFNEAAARLTESTRETEASFRDFLPAPVPFSFYLRPTTITEISNIIKNMKCSSPGHDNIHSKVVKECVDEISPFLKHIINKSFQHGIFPNQLQISKIIPVYKKGIRTNPDNYRPISLLTTFSKIFEKVMVTRLLSYIDKHALLTDCQFGFRPGYSTELAVHRLCQTIYNTMDSNIYQLSVFCDLSKAFDTISHSILAEKLSVYGIRGPALRWFVSYLSNRSHFTVFNNTNSSLKSSNSGIPQGSVLGPILFLLYVNDIVRSSNLLNFLLYADDTTVYLQGQDLVTLQNTMNSELFLVSKWIKSNKLTLNLSKTNYMISHSKYTLPGNILIKIDDYSIHKVNVVKFLGVLIDNNLMWKYHIDEIKVKISKLIGIIYRIRSSFNLLNLKQIYLSLIYPYFIYCSSIWGGAYSTYTQSLFITQKKLIRAMFNCNRYEHTHQYFRDNNIMKIRDIITLQSNLFVFNALHFHPIDTGFEPISHNIETRRALDLRLPLCRTTHAQQNILFRGARLWNQLPHDTRLASSKHSFKTKLKSQLLSNYHT